MEIKSKKYVYVLYVAMLFVAGLCCLGITYSIYLSGGRSAPTIDVAKFEIALKDGEATLSRSFNLPFRASAAGGSNKFAPGTELRTSLVLDFTDTEVSVDYNIVIPKRSFEEKVRGSGISFIVSDDDGAEVPLGKNICVPLTNRQKFSGAGARRTINFELKWNLSGDSAADTSIGELFDSLNIPVWVKVQQHIDGAENDDEKVTSCLSYYETTETKLRTVPPVNYAFDRQDVLSVNPERGFYSTSGLVLTAAGAKSPVTATKSGTSNLLYLKVDLSEFSGSMNESGTDIELTDAAVNALADALEQIKQNDNTAILRFVYDNNASAIIKDGGEERPKIEPRQTMLLKHIEKLGGVFMRYASTITVIQVGFYGLWGECYYNTDAPEHPEYYAQTVTALLRATAGTEINIVVRTPQYYAWYENTVVSALGGNTYIATASEDAYRVGVFNDAYGADSTDLGTYVDRAKETDWLHHRSSHTYYGGEAIPDATTTDGIGAFNTPTYFISEAFKLHTSYLNWEWNQALHESWAGMSHSGDEAVYRNKPALTYIENHLGYRFVLSEVRTYERAASGGKLPLDITVNNVGFGNLIKSKRADIILADEVNNIVATFENVNVNAKDFLSRSTVKKSVTLDLPNLTAGKYKIYLRLSSGEKLDNAKYYSSIRFANDDVYNSALQANYIAEFTVPPVAVAKDSAKVR